MTIDQIIYVVENNDKKRFELTKSSADQWQIRASQGHTLKKVETEELLTELKGPFTTPVIHGTSTEAWETIKLKGLSRMERNHIHFAVALPNDKSVTSGIRKTSTVFIYIDTENAIKGTHMQSQFEGC